MSRRPDAVGCISDLFVVDREKLINTFAERLSLMKLDAPIKSFCECIHKFLAVYWTILVHKQNCQVTKTIISGFVP